MSQFIQAVLRRLTEAAAGVESLSEGVVYKRFRLFQQLRQACTLKSTTDDEWTAIISCDWKFFSRLNSRSTMGGTYWL